MKIAAVVPTRGLSVKQRPTRALPHKGPQGHSLLQGPQGRRCRRISRSLHRPSRPAQAHLLALPGASRRPEQAGRLSASDQVLNTSLDQPVHRLQLQLGAYARFNGALKHVKTDKSSHCKLETRAQRSLQLAWSTHVSTQNRPKRYRSRPGNSQTSTHHHIETRLR